MTDDVDRAGRFIAHLQALQDRDRGAMAVLRRSLSFEPGTHPSSYPYVERFLGDGPSGSADRRAYYLSAGLYAMHPYHQPGQSLSRALAALMRQTGSPGIERRLTALLTSDGDGLPDQLRQIVSLLRADRRPFDHVTLLHDLRAWLTPWASDAKDRLRQRWARDFYRESSSPEDTTTDTSSIS